MKKTINLKTLAILTLGLICIVSCEKSDMHSDIVQTTVEGFKSTTGSSNEIIQDTPSRNNKPLLHMHFDKGITMNEAILRWDIAVQEFIKKEPVQNKAFSTEWYYRVWTKTGTQSNNDTDGDVGTYARFNTSAGKYNPSFDWMDNTGDDREGGWDAYLFKTSFLNKAVEWVEIDGATLYLRGKDGWFVTDFVIQLWTSDQTLPATGFSGFWASPNVWLDNSTDNGWDSYNSGNIGSGRLNF